MKSGDKALLLAILRTVPRVILAVGLQGVGAVLVIFIPAILWPEQRWLPDAIFFSYLCWSTWRLHKAIAHWSKASVGAA
jgi:hypothetical protein